MYKYITNYMIFEVQIVEFELIIQSAAILFNDIMGDT